MDQAAQNALGQAFGRRINRGDASKMDRNLLVVFDHLEFRMLHAEALSPQARFAEDDQSLSGQNHFLDVMQIEPAQDERLAQGVRFAFLQGRFKNPLPAAEAVKARLDHFTTDTNRLLAFFTREAGKFAPVLVPPRVMGEQIAHRLEPKPVELGDPRSRNPLDLA